MSKPLSNWLPRGKESRFDETSRAKRAPLFFCRKPQAEPRPSLYSAFCSASFLTLLLLISIFAAEIARAQSGRVKTANRSDSKPSSANAPSAPDSRATKENKQNTEMQKPVDSATAAPVAPAPPEKDDEQEEVVRVETNLVAVPVSVLDRNGNYVPNLQKADFRLYENNVEQEIAFFASTEAPFSVALMLDTSASTAEFREDMKRAAFAFIDSLRADDRAIIIAFDSKLHILSELTSDRDRLRAAVSQSLKFNGGTALFAAVDYVLRRAFRRVTGRKAMILFTDGANTINSTQATAQSNLHDAEESDVLIYPIQYNIFADLNKQRLPPQPDAASLPFPMPPLPQKSKRPPVSGSERDTLPIESIEGFRGRYLKALAEKTGGRRFKAEKIENIAAAFAQIADELRHQYSLGFYPAPATEAAETRQLKIKLVPRKLVVRARGSYVIGSTPAAAHK